MSRYLTPSKLILLLLTRLYSRGHIPWESRSSVLSFIASNVLPASPDNCKDIEGMLEAGGGMFFELEQVEELLKGDGEYQVEKEDGMTDDRDDKDKLWELFVGEIWKMDSVDALHEFFASISRMVVNEKPPKTQADDYEGLLDDEEEDDGTDPDDAIAQEEGREIVQYAKASPLGIFVRRARLEFTRLPFHDMIHLWHGFIRFRAATEGYWRSLNPGLPHLAFDVSLQGLGLNQNDRVLAAVYGTLGEQDEDGGKMSTNEIERLLELQVEKLQREGSRISTEMKAMFRKWIGDQATVPSLGHYVKFFDAWKAGDYSSAFDNLHRYFDFTMQSRDRTYYQYALLHLASLHADFGCFPDALSTMAETIATARENGDLHCLNFCLAWLNDLVRSHPEEVRKAGYRNGPLGTEKQGLAFLKSKAREGKTWNLLVSVLLSEARVMMSAGESPSRAVELLYQSSHLALSHQNHSNYGALWLLTSANYSRLGLSQLADDYHDTLTEAYTAFIPTDELIRAACARAFTLSRAGSYNAALSILNPLPPASKSVRVHQYATTAVRLILLQRALSRMDLRAAFSILNKLKSAHIPNEMRFEVSFLEIDYFIRSGAIDVAFDQLAVLAEKGAPEFPDDPCAADVCDRVRLLILKARLFSLSGQAERGFSAALRAANVAAKSRCIPVLWGAINSVAEILNRMGEFEGARELVDAILPGAIEGGVASGISGIGGLYEILGDSWVGQAGQTRDQHQQKQMESLSLLSTTLFSPVDSHHIASTNETDPSDSTSASASTLNHTRDLYLSRADTAFRRAGECFFRAQDVWARIRVLQKRVVISDVKGTHQDGPMLRDLIRKCVEIISDSPSVGGGTPGVVGSMSGDAWDEKWEEAGDDVAFVGGSGSRVLITGIVGSEGMPEIGVAS